MLRQDEALRTEILQDVERCMPEEEYFRKPEAQRMLLDILFVFCKMNPDVGYRQGMHELLAPILWVVENDAVDDSQTLPTRLDTLMTETLNCGFIEHDSFTIFSLLMRSAKSFYELGDPGRRSDAFELVNNQSGSSPIVDRSKRIHEVYLARLDPELASHLTTIEVLPQVFLM
jgi:TBC1 domain family member 5